MRADAEAGGAEGGEKAPAPRVFGRIRGKQPLRGAAAYVIFSNATLADMAEKAPRSLSELLEVSGVGERKASRYGEAFLRTIEEYIQQQG